LSRTGQANLVVFANKFDEYRKEIIQSKLIMVEGQVQKEGEVIHVVVNKCHNFTRLLGKLTATMETELIIKPMSRSDETSSPFPDKAHSSPGVQANIFHDGRNFR
jgi:error-prone DNA polymerase